MKELLQLQNDILYGPLNSRRLGRSLGLNLLPTTFKLCSMNCCYCQYGWTTELTAKTADAGELPTANEVAAALKSVLQTGETFDYLTFSGNGEATLHPEFTQIVDIILEMRLAFKANFKLALLSNGTTAGDPALRHAFDKIDLPIIKLDAGNEKTFKRVNHGVPPIKLADILSGIKTLKNIVIQTMFVQGSIDNSTDKEVSTWIERLQEIRPRWVQIYSLDRGTADKNLQVVEQQRLQQIADMLESRTGIISEVY